MALTVLERFYDNADWGAFGTPSGGEPLVFLRKFYGALTNPSSINSSPSGRNGTTAYSFLSSQPAILSFLPQIGTPTGAVLGFAFATNLNANARHLIAFKYQGNDVFYIRMNASKRLDIVDAGGNTIATGTLQAGGLGISSYQYIQVAADINGPSSAIEVRVGNTTDATYSGALTASAFDEIAIRTTGATDATRFDDIYIHTGTGAFSASDFLGDVVIYSLAPDADASPMNWTPILSTPNEWTRIDDTPASDPPNEYLYEDTNTEKFFVSHAPVNAAATSIAGLLMVNYVGKGGFGASAVNARQVIQTSTSAYQNGAPKELYGEWRYIRNSWATNPVTLLPWTKSDIDSASFGMEKVL